MHGCEAAMRRVVVFALFLCGCSAGCDESERDGGEKPGDAGQGAEDGGVGEPLRLRSADEFVSAGIDIAGGTCLGCWRVFRVETPGVLVLEDELGEERFEVTDEEYEEVVDVVVSLEFQRELNRNVTWECGDLLDLETLVKVQWKEGQDGGAQGDAGVQQARLSDGCFGRCDQPDHPYMKLRGLLFDLKYKYMYVPNCDRQYEHSPLSCSLIEHHPLPPPINRMLCLMCLEDCGENGL